MNKEERIKELIDILTKASKAYYEEDEEIMSNFEYDALYDELVKLEQHLAGLQQAEKELSERIEQKKEDHSKKYQLLKAKQLELGKTR